MDINNVNYDWQFNPLESYPTASGKLDMVFNVHWQLYATTGSYSASSIGVIDIPYDPNSEWYEFTDLTKAEVQHWVEDRMNIFNPDAVTQLKEGLAAIIENQINPPVLVQQSPWLNTTSTTTTTTTIE
jgi:hypothetical protein